MLVLLFVFIFLPVSVCCDYSDYDSGEHCHTSSHRRRPLVSAACEFQKSTFTSIRKEKAYFFVSSNHKLSIVWLQWIHWTMTSLWPHQSLRSHWYWSAFCDPRFAHKHQALLLYPQPYNGPIRSFEFPRIRASLHCILCDLFRFLSAKSSSTNGMQMETVESGSYSLTRAWLTGNRGLENPVTAALRSLSFYDIKQNQERLICHF